MAPQGRGKAVDGVDARMGSGGGWNPHEASHIPMWMGVWRHARGGDALWRHKAGAGGAPRPWTGPQGVLQLKRERKQTHESVAPGAASLPRGSLFTHPPPVHVVASPEASATASQNEIFLSDSFVPAVLPASLRRQVRAPLSREATCPLSHRTQCCSRSPAGQSSHSIDAWDLVRPRLGAGLTWGWLSVRGSTEMS